MSSVGVASGFGKGLLQTGLPRLVNRPGVAGAVLHTASLLIDSVSDGLWKYIQTSLLRRLQAQTLPDEAPPAAKIYPFSKIVVTFEPIQRF